MEWTMKKTFVLLGIFVLIILTPVFLVTNTAMDWYHKRIDKNPKTDNSKWMTLKTAGICFDTWRPQRAADYYKKYLTNYPDDEKIPEVRFHHARSLEECLKYAEAAEIYQQIQLDYPENFSLSKKAKEGWARCKYGIGNR